MSLERGQDVICVPTSILVSLTDMRLGNGSITSSKEQQPKQCMRACTCTHVRMHVCLACVVRSVSGTVGGEGGEGGGG